MDTFRLSGIMATAGTGPDALAEAQAAAAALLAQNTADEAFIGSIGLQVDGTYPQGVRERLTAQGLVIPVVDEEAPGTAEPVTAGEHRPAGDMLHPEPRSALFQPEGMESLAQGLQRQRSRLSGAPPDQVTLAASLLPPVVDLVGGTALASTSRSS